MIQQRLQNLRAQNAGFFDRNIKNAWILNIFRYEQVIVTLMRKDVEKKVFEDALIIFFLNESKFIHLHHDPDSATQIILHDTISQEIICPMHFFLEIIVPV